MLILKALFVVVLIVQSTFGTTTTELNQIEYSEGTSVETKPSLPAVNIGVNPTSGNFSESSYTIQSSLRRVLDFYNTELLASNWNRIKKSVSAGCQKDVEAYIHGLGKAENWALKSKLICFIFYNIL